MDEDTSASSSTRATKIIERCRELAHITDVPGETTRLFLSQATSDAQALLLRWMREAGLETRVDDVGSVRAVRRARSSNAPTLLIFSHIDTVPNAGPFDGVLGVILGLGVLEELGATELPFHIELIAFSEEEGVRFSLPFISALALTGRLTPEHLARRDAGGISVAEAIRDFGLNPEALAETCALPPKTFVALEIHIEQGPVLDRANESLGVVEGIAGQSRLRFSFEGVANHAGTTPMSLRQDALVAAAKWIVEVEHYAAAREPLVATVGRMEILPGAVNVIPGRVNATLDVRHPEDAVRKEAVAAIETAARGAAISTHVRVSSTLTSEQASVPMDRTLITELQHACERTGHAARTMFSGAGHDAMIVAPQVPTAMLFVRSPSGLSHHPEENVYEQDVEAAVSAITHLLLHLQPSQTFLNPEP